MPDPAVAQTDRASVETVANRLRREVYDLPMGPERTEVLKELLRTEEVLAKIPRSGPSDRGLIISTQPQQPRHFLSAETTGLAVSVHLRMTQLPASIVHLLDPEKYPLVEISAKNAKADKTRRVRVTTFVEGYSARVVDTVELPPLAPAYIFRQLPAFFSDRLATLHELTRALVNVSVEDLDGAVELQNTKPFWIAPNTSAMLFAQDPANPASLIDFTPYLGAYVTPNDPGVMRFLREAARARQDEQLVGYQGEPEGVESQVKALFDALKKADVTYINSVLASSADTGVYYQRVRLPRQTLTTKSANCIDGTVLFASLLEAISLNPALVLVPGHAFVGWETWSNSGTFNYLETTMIGTSAFEDARKSAEEMVTEYKAVNPPVMTLHSILALRRQGIYPMG